MPSKIKGAFSVASGSCDYLGFQQAHIHLSNSSGHCRASPCSHQQLSSSRATSPSNHLPTSGPLMAVLAKWGGRESIAVIHVGARAATACTPNPSSSNKKVEAGTLWQCNVCRLWSHLPTSLFMDLLLRKILFQHGWLVGLPILITRASSICCSTRSKPMKTTGVLQLSHAL